MSCPAVWEPDRVVQRTLEVVLDGCSAKPAARCRALVPPCMRLLHGLVHARMCAPHATSALHPRKLHGSGPDRLMFEMIIAALQKAHHPRCHRFRQHLATAARLPSCYDAELPHYINPSM